MIAAWSFKDRLLQLLPQLRHHAIYHRPQPAGVTATGISGIGATNQIPRHSLSGGEITHCCDQLCGDIDDLSAVRLGEGVRQPLMLTRAVRGDRHTHCDESSLIDRTAQHRKVIRVRTGRGIRSCTGMRWHARGFAGVHGGGAGGLGSENW